MTIVWDDDDRPPIVTSLTSFQMPDIKRFTTTGCPRAHLRLYRLVMRGLGRDDGQFFCLISIIFELSSTTVVALLDPSR